MRRGREVPQGGEEVYGELAESRYNATMCSEMTPSRVVAKKDWIDKMKKRFKVSKKVVGAR